MDRTVPFDLGAERAVLGACLIEREAIVAVRNQVASADFYLEKHAWLYEAFLDCLADRVPPDTVTVADRLRQRERLDLVGGVGFLGELVGDVGIAVHVEHHARIVAKAARSRRMIELGAEIVARAYDNDPDQVIEQAEQMLELERTIATSPDDWQGQMHDGHDIWGKPYTPRPFVVDEILPVGITLLHALPKKRKSWLAKNLCYAVASGGKALGHLQAQQGEALYLNLEMDEELLIERLRVMYPDGAPPAGVKFFYEWPNLENGFFSRLENYVTARPWTRLIVVDTLVRVLPDEAFNREGYRLDARLIEPFTKFNANRGLAILLIHHSRKVGGSNDPILAASGSTGLTGSVDSVLELQVDGEESSKGRLTRSGRRIKNDKPLALKWDVQIGNWIINMKAGQLTPERKAVLEVVEEHGPMSTQKIAALLERPAPSIRRMCAEMLTCGQLVSIQGLYAAPEIDMA
jgi:hypothetical protein